MRDRVWRCLACLNKFRGLYPPCIGGSRACPPIAVVSPSLPPSLPLPSVYPSLPPSLSLSSHHHLSDHLSLCPMCELHCVVQRAAASESAPIAYAPEVALAWPAILADTALAASAALITAILTAHCSAVFSQRFSFLSCTLRSNLRCCAPAPPWPPLGSGRSGCFARHRCRRRFADFVMSAVVIRCLHLSSPVTPPPNPAPLTWQALPTQKTGAFRSLGGRS